jgi:RHS repeat-associated protein
LDLSGTEQGAGGIGGLLWMTSHLPLATSHFASFDGNGNVAALLNAATGEVSAEYEYGPFGETIRATGPAAAENVFRFSAKYTDAETGLMYYGYRYYQPSTGRWPSRDPIEERGGLNFYGFVRNDGVNSYDFLGLQKCKHSTPNGCGPENPKWLNVMIPEGFFPKLGGYNFGPACDAHDICWGVCGADRKTCDDQFLKDLQTQCDKWVDKLYGPGGIYGWIGDGKLKEIDRRACYRDAKVYHRGVSSKLGDGAFKEAQKEACACKKCFP